MKVLADLGNGKLMVETDGEELARLLGYSCLYQVPKDDKPRLGMELNVTKFGERMEGLKRGVSSLGYCEEEIDKLKVVVKDLKHALQSVACTQKELER